jgi:cell volume regulation protein A
MSLTAENILLVGSILLFISIFVSKAGAKIGVPALLLFLGVGMLGGTDGFGIHFNNPGLTQFIGLMALSIILFSGGMDTRFSEIKPIMSEGVVLATAGVLATALITGVFIHYLSNAIGGFISLGWIESFLLASVMSSTDSASVFSILRSKSMQLKHNVRPLLELESGSNDPMAYMLMIFFISLLQASEASIAMSALNVVIQLVVGFGGGILLGNLTRFIINHSKIGNEALYPVLLFALVFFIFTVTDLAHGNGYLAVYIAGLVVGNKPLLHKKNLMTFFDGFTWLWQLIMFLTLGLLVEPSQLFTIKVAGAGILIGLFMIIVARPITVFLCLIPFRKLPFKTKLYVSWIGLRGAVPIIFATYPLVAGVENAGLFFNLVFFITILSLLTQGTTVTLMAKLLKIAEPEVQSSNMFGIELPEEIKSAMSEFEVVPSVLSKGDLLMDINLPDNTLVVMIKRDHRYFVPKGNTHLQLGDKLVLISDNEAELYKAYSELGVQNYSVRKN